MKLTYKDLKALYKPEVYFQKKAIENFLYLTLSEALPILKDDIEWFINFLSTQSKQSLDKTDEKGLLRGELFQWNDKYLDQSKRYQDLNRKMRFVIRHNIMQTDDNEIVEPFTLQEWLTLVRETTENFGNFLTIGTDSDYEELIDWLVNSSDKDAQRIKYFIELSFASTFNHISLIQNKATISYLLNNAINENKVENFKKIFSVDPSVFDLPIVQQYINNQDRKTKALIHKYYSESIEIPTLSNMKNKVSQKPMFIIGLLNSMGVINGQICFSKTRLLNLGTIAGIDNESIDQTYFNRLLLHIKEK